MLNESRKELMRFLSTIEDESILAKSSDASSSWRIIPRSVDRTDLFT